jgi:tyrosine-protein kinase Etk/Wzc
MQEQTLPPRDEILSEPLLSRGEGSTMQEGEIDLLELTRVFLSEKVFVLKCALITAGLAAVVLLIMRPTYTAEATFLPPNSMSSGASSSLLGQLSGLSSASGALGSLRDPTQIYLGMLKSRTIADDLISRFDLAKVYKTKKLSQTEKALESHSEFTSGKDTVIVIDVKDHDPKRAADLANAYLMALHKLNDRIALTDAGQRRLFFEQQLEKEKNSLADAEVELAKSQEQTGLILPGGQTRLQIETIARTQAEISNREIQLQALSQAATEQNPDVIRIRSEIAGLKAQLNKLETSTGNGGAGNVEVPTARVPALTLAYVRKEREVKYHEVLYELLLRQYESSRLDESRSAPLMQVVDYAAIPDSKSGPKRLLFTLLAFVLGGFVGTLWVFVEHGLATMSKEPANEAKLTALREAAQWRRRSVSK